MSRIPQIRENIATTTAIVIAIASMGVGAVFVDENFRVRYLVTTPSLIIVLLTITEVAYRLLLFLEEKNHLTSRYDGKIKILLKDTFLPPVITSCLFVLSSFMLVIQFFINNNEYPWDFWIKCGTVPVTASFFAFLLLSKCLDLHFCLEPVTKTMESTIPETENINSQLLVEVREIKKQLNFLSNQCEILFNDNKELVNLLKYERKKLKKIMDKYKIDEEDDDESESPLYDSLRIQKVRGLDYGSGMAYSFFYGYLKLILPKSGTEELNLMELMKIYEAREGISFEAYKLIVLIPLSLQCPVSLENENNPTIEAAKSLDPKIITVAGVTNRVYKNAVYKINTEEGKKYISVEYASPLKTFRDVIRNVSEHASYYEKHQKELVLQFYMTLKRVLQENVDCRDFCELIFFDDLNASNRPCDVAPIIMEKIREIQANN